MIDVLGFLAGLLMFIGIIPQVYQVVKTHNTHALNLSTQVIYLLAGFMWIWFAILVGSWTAAAFNILTTILSFVIIYYKLKFK